MGAKGVILNFIIHCPFLFTRKTRIPTPAVQPPPCHHPLCLLFIGQAVGAVITPRLADGAASLTPLLTAIGRRVFEWVCGVGSIVRADYLSDSVMPISQKL